MIGNTENYEVERQHRPEDDIESTWNELFRAHDYSGIDEKGEYIYPQEKLEEMGRYWLSETNNVVRSERSRQEASKIADLIVFEIAFRKGEIRELEELYSGTRVNG